MKRQARQAAADALAEARDPLWYSHYAVPDTFDGRFEVAVLALFLRLYGNATLSQPAFDAFFRQMALTLREMGIGDLSVPRHMKRMMNGFNGRVRAYWQAADAGDAEAFAAALTRNVYGTMPDIAPKTVEMLAQDMLKRLTSAGEKNEIAAP